MLSSVEILILSAIQGISEFLPVSSVAHLDLIAQYYEFNNKDLLIYICLHMGSLIAIIFYFRNEIFSFAKNRNFLIKILNLLSVDKIMKILIVVAHPDDEVLGMGGTIKKLSNQGNELKTIFLSTGILARRPFSTKTGDKIFTEKFLDKVDKKLKKLRTDAKNAAKVLGVDEIDFMDFPDNEMDLISNLEITKINIDQTNQVIMAVNPDIPIAVFIIVFAANAPAKPSSIIIKPAK